MVRGLDPASVAATTRFPASRVQPSESAHELASIEAPVLLVPGADPEHPAEIAEIYARHLRRSVSIDPARSNLAERIAWFSRDLR